MCEWREYREGCVRVWWEHEGRGMGECGRGVRGGVS